MTYQLLENYSGLQEWLQNLLQHRGLTATWSGLAAMVINLIVLFIICWISYWVINRIIQHAVKIQIGKSNNPDTQIFVKKRAFLPLAYLIPELLLFNLSPVFFRVSDTLAGIARTFMIIIMIVTILVVIKRVLKSLEYIGLRSSKFEHKPIGSYIQMIMLLIYLICGVLILSILIGKSPLTILTAFGAGMAIIILVFKDTILGLIASIQISVNDMVRLGDWIEVPNYNADGDLIEINLMTVKIRNWDKTVTNVPTYALVSNGFKNWREMQDLGIRRLMQHILIDVSTIKEVDNQFLLKLQKKYQFSETIEHLQWAAKSSYEQEKVTTITNLGLFRRYVEDYLNRHPGVSDVYVVVRHLQQTGEGLPLGIYAFSNNVNWKPLQQLQADIFEHFYAIISDFDLAVFQRPSSRDLREFGYTAEVN